MSTGINDRRHTHKLKSGKAKRNAKKKKSEDAGFVNRGRVAYRSEGGLLFTAFYSLV